MPAQQAFEKLKLQMTQMSILHLPNFKLPFVVETDASAVAVGVVLSQIGHPLAFFNKKMNPKLQLPLYTSGRCMPSQSQ